MDSKDKNMPYGLENATDVPADQDDYSLEEILAEFGGSLEHMLLKGTAAAPPEEETPPPPPDPVPPPPQPVVPKAQPLPPENPPVPPQQEIVPPPLPEEPPPEEEEPKLEDILADPSLREPAAPSIEMDILDMALPKAPPPCPWRTWWAAPSAP